MRGLVVLALALAGIGCVRHPVPADLQFQECVRVPLDAGVWEGPRVRGFRLPR